ncbi:MAG: hypothetical protein ACREXP_30890 [Steroidobacteraceae bacterium]
MLLACWILVTLVGLGSLSLSHMVAMPKPDPTEQLARALLDLRRDPRREFLVHVIYADCSCTERLFTHLLERGPFAHAEEIILFAGEDPAKQRSARRAGFEFLSISPALLVERYLLEAAPVLVAFDAAGRLNYLGGYFAHPAAIAPLDERLHRDLMRGGSPDPLPVFGCAVSTRLQKAVDPLGVLY